MKALNGIGEEFAKPHCGETQDVVFICKGAGALNNKREQKKKQEAAKAKGCASVRVGTTKEETGARIKSD